MQFQVPQFIEVEDKIFGPLTFKQFIYLGGGLGTAYIFWRLLPIYISGPLVLAIGGLTFALAFFQVNGRPFIIAVENAFFYIIGTKLYLWSNDRKPEKHAAAVKMLPTGPEIYVPKLSESKLHDLAWSLDIQERIAAGVREGGEATRSGVVAPMRTARDALVR